MTALLTALIGLGAGLELGAVFWGRYSDTVDAQAEEIEALQSDNLRLRGQAAELATLAHEAQAMAASEKNRADNLIQDCVVAADHGAVALLSIQERKTEQAESMLAGEIAAHRATKRKLATTRAWVTRLRKASDER